MAGRSNSERVFRAALKPIGLAMLAGSAALALAAAIGVPQTGRWQGHELWLVVWGAALYAAFIVTNVLTTSPSFRARKEELVPSPPPAPVPGPISPRDLRPSIEAALRCLDDPAKLASCGLHTKLPHTLAKAAGEAGLLPANLTPLQLADLLGAVMRAHIEKLRQMPPNNIGRDAKNLRYFVLHEEYVLSLPNVQIMTRYGTPEKTFFTRRREAITLLTAEVAAYESRLSRSDVQPATL